MKFKVKQTAAAREKFPQELPEADIGERWSSRCELPVQSSVLRSRYSVSTLENKYLAAFVFTGLLTQRITGKLPHVCTSLFICFSYRFTQMSICRPALI